MCTVSIVRHECGVRVLCNRDERRSRAPAFAPTARCVNGRRAVFPVDPVGGGTWIGVNDAGLAAALLNRTDRHQPRPALAPRQSRGAIVPLVLGTGSPDDALCLVGQLDRSDFAPYRLVVLQANDLWIISGGGAAAPDVRHQRLTAPRVLASSSLGDDLVESPRRRLFAELLLAAADPLQAQQRFHQHQWPDRTAVSVMMQRDDARTVSRTQVDMPAMLMRYEETGGTDSQGRS